MSKFKTFLESIRTEQNANAINCILEGYQAIFENPTIILGEFSGVNDSFDQPENNLDLHVEDIISIEGPEKALAYVTDILRKLQKKEGTITVPSQYIRKGDDGAERGVADVSEIKNELEYNTILDTMTRFYNGLKKHVDQLVPA